MSDGPSARFDPDDELSLLGDEAEEFGIALDAPPRVERVTCTTGDGATISVLRWGAEPPEVVLLHGMGLNAHTWDATLLALGRPALAVDLPGHGHSSWRGDGDYTPATNAATLADVVVAHAPNAAAIVGQSLGGLTAIALGATHPDLVRRLALVDISPGLSLADAAPVRDFLDGATEFGSIDEIVERAHAFGIGPSRSALWRGVWHNTRRRDDGTVVFRHHLTSLPTGAPFLLDLTVLWPPLDALHASGAPVSLVRGTRGFLRPEVVDEFRRRLPAATVTEVDAGHNVQEDAPVPLAAAIAHLL